MDIREVLERSPYVANATEKYIQLAAYANIAQRKRLKLHDSAKSGEVLAARDLAADFKTMLDEYQKNMGAGWAVPDFEFHVQDNRPTTYFDADGNLVSLPGMLEYETQYNELMAEFQQQETEEFKEAAVEIAKGALDFVFEFGKWALILFVGAIILMSFVLNMTQ